MFWKENMETGVRELDEKLKSLVEGINLNIRKMNTSRNPSLMIKQIEDLKACCVDYFTYQETMMAISNYPLYHQHKHSHEILLDKKPIFIQRKKPLKKDLPTEEIKEIKRAKAKFNTGKVEPMYKKKKMFAIEKVKKKYRKMAIRKSIRQKKNEYYRKKNAD